MITDAVEPETNTVFEQLKLVMFTQKLQSQQQKHQFPRDGIIFNVINPIHIQHHPLSPISPFGIGLRVGPKPLFLFILIH